MSLHHLRAEAGLLLDEKIGEGQHREVFRSDPFAVKILKPYRVKKYWRHTERLPMQDYLWQKFRIEDFNQHEYENYRRLAEFIPDHLRDCFNPVHWAGFYEGRSVSLSGLVYNDNGSFAQPLAKIGVVLDEKFWSTLDEVENLFLTCKMFFIGINSENLLVRTKNGVQQPVFVDYKWLGREAYPCQFWLRSERGLIHKLRGKFQRMREAYQPQ